MQNIESPDPKNTDTVPANIEELKKIYRDELLRYRENPDTFVAYHEKMEQIDRWLEQESRK